MRRIEKARAAYEEAGLKRAEHKAFIGITSFKAWGAEIAGIRGCVGAPIALRRQVWGWSSLVLPHRIAYRSYWDLFASYFIIGVSCFPTASHLQICAEYAQQEMGEAPWLCAR